jgi:DNA-binding IclR family transcriptional regulator
MTTVNEAVRPIRSLLRGLDVIAALSEGDGLTVTETARRVRLPRTTTYRVLETLRSGGYVLRDDMDRYRPTERVTIAGAAARNGAQQHHANGRADAA